MKLIFVKNIIQKHNHEIINKYYFACNMYGFNFDNKENTSKETYPVQFAYFFDLCNWLMALIKQNANINILQEIDIKFKKYDKKKQQEIQMQELLNDLKNLQIKVLFNSRFKYGYGDGVCLVLTQLCDKYLIKQNFIFKKPKFQDIQEIEKIKEYPDDIPLEENIGTNIGFKSNTNYNFSGYKSLGGGSKTKFYSGQKFKHFASIGPINDENSTNYSAQGDEDSNNKNTNINNENAILYSNIPEEDWQKEFNKVSNMLEIAEVSDEYFGSFSESSSNNKDNNKNEGNYPTVKYIKNMNKLLDDKLLDDIDIIDNYSKNIETELNYISNKENKLGVNNTGLKDELNKLKITKQANIHYQEEYDTICEDIKKMEKEKNKIEYELDKIKKQEKKILTVDDKNNLQKIKKAIENIYQDNNKIDEEISLINTVLINKYSNILNDNLINENNNGINIFNGKNLDIEKITENINNEGDVFDDDEII